MISLLLGYLEIVVLFEKFLLELLGLVLEHGDLDHAIGLEPCDIKVNWGLVADILGQLLDLVHELIVLL